MTGDDETNATAALDAGEFGAWLDEIVPAIRGERDIDVPCGRCTACCTSSQFVHIGPDEVDVLAHIPTELLFAAPRMPRGHVLMGYDERGHCPMLVDGVCSIYAHRPRTCRTYDCRVFPASGLLPDEPTKVEIRRRAGRWRFSYADDDARRRHGAVTAAAVRLEHDGELPDEVARMGATSRAVLAIEIHRVLLIEEATDDELRDSVRDEVARRLPGPR